MGAFATVEDYVERYPGTVDIDRVETLLKDAGSFLESELRRSGKEVDDSDESQRNALVRISCRLVNSMMDVSDGMSGVSQSSMTAGPFSNSWTFANPTGAFKLLQSERKTLGVGGVRAGSVEPLIHDA